ncbi:MAG: outer membrane lipoprotein carrier protein LolA [Rhodospirillaceae bacterium]
MKQTAWGAAKFLSVKSANWFRLNRIFPSFRRIAIGLRAGFLFVCLTLLSLSAAQADQLAKLTSQDRADIKRIEAYLNELSTVAARFLQVSSSGGYAEGRLYISRPGKMRIDYAPPSKIEIVADGKSLIYHDKELEQISYIDLADTPANILLQKNIRFTHGPLRVRNVTRSPGIVRLSVFKKEDPEEGVVTLVFSDKPLTLKKWVITDAQGVVTTVSLLRSRFSVPIDPKIFKFEDPDYELYRDDT